MMAKYSERWQNMLTDAEQHRKIAANKNYQAPGLVMRLAAAVAGEQHQLNSADWIEPLLQLQLAAQ